ncbi:MMPL family transporter [Aeromicrobium duanguangcaii]|uniref:MMPL family transporter n=1 Tax=Aeromicrobium duanguangcaii TaxID=2968086 RepID=A0ABY5KIJ8_9ACTN|nr:MMPL family transporter [Aeromicrobium duanguangcaii]MCD9155166.1 MMPL family transporter [Aeromicrobium duanguangcaii]UUI68183.1 MMPL family transporter [Aeromicrobium duanguangcaii]
MNRRAQRTFPLAHLVGPKRSIVVVLLGFVVAGLIMAFAPDPTTGSEAGSNLPDSAESARAQAALKKLPNADEAPAIVVYSKDGGLDGRDLAAIAERSRAISSELGVEVSPPVPAEDQSAALVAVPFETGLESDENKDRVKELRDLAKQDLPDGVKAQATGAPAVQADLGAVFAGADVRLLAVTAAVVAILLIVTYRSPWLWLVPLTIIGIGDRVAARALEGVSGAFDVGIDGSITGITSVLVFGAGTNYALLLIARYREELRRHSSRHEAMRTAVGGAAPAILSSSGTVVLALLSLLIADSPFVSAIGWSGALGIAVAVAFALLVLPSAMVIPGRWLFWPFVPREGDADPSEKGWWFRVGTAVTSRPWPTTIAALAVLTAMAAGLLGLNTGLGQSEQFLDTPESITAQETLQDNFAAGISSPTTVVTSPDKVESVVAAANQVEGVESARPANATDDLAEVQVVLSVEPESEKALTTIEDLRTAVHDADPDSLVGGTDAQALDENQTASDDRRRVIPIVLAIVLVMLLVLLRSVVAAVLLCATTVLSYLSALGVGWVLFDRVLGWSAMDVSTPLLAFIFLVALGVDYNIFLTARAREEMVVTGDATASIVKALAVTGGVITSAGILLAAVFAVLGVLPLVLLAQLGVIVGFGVLLDTVLVRGVATPAIVALCGRWFWWPSKLSR